MSSVQYRREVDGIRAIAVVSVILFHAGLTEISGGFLGVDVFFVISGYLITGIILKDLEDGQWNVKSSIINFYLRRSRRILPALFVMIFISTIVAVSILLPDDIQNFGQSVFATITFSNNILLFLTNGYFSENSDFKPLIHTWSLGVEEQYYLIIPLLMNLAFWFEKRKGVICFIIIIAAGSLITSISTQQIYPQANFYLIFPRAWELCAGGLAVIFEPNLRRISARSQAVMATVGLSATVLSLFVLDASMNLPGLATLLPVVGTAVMLVYARSSNIAGRVLGLAPLVWVGLLSYSAYLYHQPIFAFARLLSIAPTSKYVLLSLVPAIFLISYLSWRFVENPFRDSKRFSNFSLLILTFTGSGVLAAVGLYLHFSQGLYATRWRDLARDDPGFGVSQNVAFNLRVHELEARPFRSGRPRVLVLGNSFARDFVNMSIASGSIEPFRLSYLSRGDCESLNEPERALAQQADFIVLGSGVDAGNLECIRGRAAELSTISLAKTIILGTKNFGYNNNAVMRYDDGSRYSLRVAPLPHVTAADEMAKRNLAGLTYVSILDLLVASDGRVPVFTPDRKFISQDRQHLTEAGAAYLGGLLFRHPAMRPLMRPAHQ